MKSLLRIVSLVIVIVLVVGGAPSSIQKASAQSNCKLKGLSSADCKLIADAGDNLANLKTFVMDYTVTFQAKGLPNGNINFSAQGSGPVDVSAVDDANGLNALSSAIFASNLKATLTEGGKTQSGTLDLRMVDGVLYITASRFPQSNSKLDVSQLLDAIPEQARLALAANVFNFDRLATLQNTPAADIPGVYQAKAQNGRVVEGQAMTQIALDTNLSTYFSYLFRPENREQLRAVLEASGQQYTDDQLNQIARAIPLLRTTLQATKLQETWLIGKKDKLYHGWGLTFSTRIDPTLINMLGSQQDSPVTQPITVNASLQVTLTKIGKPVTVQAIDDAEDITDQVIAIVSGGSVSSGGNGNPGNPNTPDDSGNTSDPEAIIPDGISTRYARIPAGKTSDGFATLGNAKAPVKIVQLSSYSCGACQEYYTGTIVPILDEMKAGNVYYTFIPVTLTGEYDAAPATAAAYCALQQGKFWQMHDVLFDWQIRYGSDSADADRLRAGAKALNMDVDQFDECFASEEAQQLIEAANDRFNQLNLDSTPSVFVNGKLFHPAANGQEEPNLRDYIKQLTYKK